MEIRTIITMEIKREGYRYIVMDRYQVEEMHRSEAISFDVLAAVIVQ